MCCCQVLFDLPVKSELVLYTGLSETQRNIYKAILTKDLCEKIEIQNSICIHSPTFIFHSMFHSHIVPFPYTYSSPAAFGDAGNKTRLLNVLAQLRKCINHPYLFDGNKQVN